MRRIFLAFLFFLTNVGQSSAQDTVLRPKVMSYQVSIGYGRASTTTLLEGVTAGKEGNSETPIARYTGTFNTSFHAVFMHRIGLGVAFAFENEEGEWHKRGQYTGNGVYSPQMGSFRRNVYTIAIEMVLNYSRETEGLVTTYGYVGYGRSFLNEIGDFSEAYYNTQYVNGVNSLGPSLEVSRDRTEDNFQVCPIGIRVGKKYSGFFELGFGYKGIYNFGFSLLL